MKLEKLANGIYVSPMQFNVAPETIQLPKYNFDLGGNYREGDIASRIIEESSKHGKFVAVTRRWLADEYHIVVDLIQSGHYKLESPFAKQLTGVNAGQVFDCTLQKIGNEGTYIGRQEITPDFTSEVPYESYFITPLTLGIALLKK